MTDQKDTPENTSAGQAEDTLQGSAGYEVLKRRLESQGEALAAKARQLNEARIREFGRSEAKLLARLTARTENNCIARDIVRVGDLLLFGYNVFMGLKKETAVDDVFALYRMVGSPEAPELEAVPAAGTFLTDQRFLADFRELYAYYKDTRLTQLRINQQKLLAAFQIGQKVGDLRVFRWALNNDGSLQYIDNRGERDVALPPAHDFEWTPTRREDHVGGRHPHINILDTVFVETIGGDLTVKVENNTETGLGIYSEPVEDKTQSLADAEIAYARLGSLILLKVRPYREKEARYLVFNARTQSVQRIDAIGRSCVQLPEDHGIVFPGGYLLQSGDSKRFDLPPDAIDGLLFKRMVRAPNGEDVLYVFYEPAGGRYGLFTYNLIEKTLGTPILANGYARFDDGRVLVFHADAEPVRSHPMQVWATPFISDEHARKAPAAQGFFGKIGNPELVRGVSELYGISRAVAEQAPTRVAFEDLIRQCTRVLDSYFWLEQREALSLAAEVKAIQATARSTLDEFDRVEAMRREAARLLQQAQAGQHEVLTGIASKLWQHPNDFVAALDALRLARGKLAGLHGQRYIDTARLAAMDTELSAEEGRVGERAIRFLAEDKAFQPYRQALEKIATALPAAATSQDITQLIGELDQIAHGLDLLTELLGNLGGGDATVRTAILDEVGLVYADVNRLRAEARNRKKAQGSREAAAEFGAQFKLFGQAVDNALEFADTPEKCDEALTRLLARLEELEGRFAEATDFLGDIAAKRESVLDAFEAKKQTLQDARNRRVEALQEAAKRVLAGVPKRVAQMRTPDELNAYFAADPLLAKLRAQVADLRGLGAAVVADDLDTQLKTARDQALRGLRDRQELAGDDGNTLRLGRHLFTVSRQTLDLSLVPRGDRLHFHLTGTDYFAPADAPELEALRDRWDQMLVSETRELYRAEYLAYHILQAARHSADGLDPAKLDLACTGPEAAVAALDLVRTFAAPRYLEGYQKGIHDADAAALLRVLVPMEREAGLLSFGPRARALAAAYWQQLEHFPRETLQREARSAVQLRNLFGARKTLNERALLLAWELTRFGPDAGFFQDAGDSPTLAREAADYLLEQLAQLGPTKSSWVVSGAGDNLAAEFSRHLERAQQLADWKAQLEATPARERLSFARQWVASFAALPEPAGNGAVAWIDDAAAVLALALPRERVNAGLSAQVTGLLGDHPRIVDGTLAVNLNDFHARCRHHQQTVVPAYEALQRLRQQVTTAERQRLKLADFQAKPLSSFVRNRLIDEVYLPLIGDNLAKQLGTAGDTSRTDRMGLLLLISPPGYGKTTLMEYIADRLGLVFVRINCPALGHDVVSLDPVQAPHSAARSELEKLNLGLAMGNNVMLYLDDIQHTHPEFLQKFIALSDGTRRIEGVWQGEARTWDLRGKRFAVVMAGNPYTESGAVFKIPDMLANRADIYNLGDVLSGREALFALSYLENSLTSNSVLQPLANRDPKDVPRLVRLAAGEDLAPSEFAHPYSSAELSELVAVVRHLLTVRDVLLKVNAAYIASAAQDDAYRTEPPFKLQGSYRNMAKLAAKVTSTLQADELQNLIRDHYRGEAQTLTTGAEENLLRLVQLLGTPTPEEASRWQGIVDGFRLRQRQGGKDADGATRVANLLAEIATALDRLQTTLEPAVTQSIAQANAGPAAWQEGFLRLQKALQALKPEVKVEVPVTSPETPAAVVEAVERMARLYEHGLVPLVSAAHHKMRLDHSIWENVRDMSKEVQRLDKILESMSRRVATPAPAQSPPTNPTPAKRHSGGKPSDPQAKS